MKSGLKKKNLTYFHQRSISILLKTLINRSLYQLKRFTFQLRKRPTSLRNYYWFCHVFIPIGLNQKISDKKSQKICHNFLVSNIGRTGAIPEIYWAFSTRKFNKVAYFLLTSVNISHALRDLLPFVQFKKRECYF